MNIKLTHADEQMIRRLESRSAFTWEGMTLDDENIAQIARIFLEEGLVKSGTDEIEGFIWYGAEMNNMYGLHGENAYQDDLPFLCFDNDTFDGEGNLNVFKMAIGARWLDDITRNNSLNEEG